MIDRVIKKAELTELLSRLMDHYRLWAPVRHQDMTSFQEISATDQMDLNYVNTTFSPKSLMLPQSESMFQFTLMKTSERARILQEFEKDFSPRVIFAIRPCDAKSFQLLDLNFDTPLYRDPWWTGYRQSTTLVGMGCNQPCSTCFCTSVGSGPFSTEGLDLLLMDAGDEFAIQTLTGKGEELLAKISVESEVSKAVADAVLARQESSLKAIESRVAAENLKRHEVTTLFNAEFWDELHFACINCGICTFTCPTCWCFDIQDEVHKDDGIRLRNWDSCMFPLFTLHGSGHNPRAQKLQRLRQRFMHKLKYFVDKYDRGVACVGCGRCVQQCPVNIDIREVFHLMNSLKV